MKKIIKGKIEFECLKHDEKVLGVPPKPFKFETKKWIAYDHVEDGVTMVRVEATCLKCQGKVSRYIHLSKIFEMVWTIEVPH